MPHLLLVDDHSIVRSGLKQLIEDFLAHCKIDEAPDGDSAFEKIKQTDYDLVIMDVNMPQTDSFGMVSTILSFKPETKIIMFSMNAEEVYAKRYLNLGAMGYLRKDASSEEIKKAIHTVLDHKRYLSAELSERLLSELTTKKNNENPFDKLSPREFEIARHLSRGESIAEISIALNLHSSTTGTHKARIFQKLQCHNIVELNNLAQAYHIIFST